MSECRLPVRTTVPPTAARTAFGVLVALGGNVEDLESQARRRLAGKDPDTSRDAEASTCQAPDAVCVDEAHEALALAARVASSLAATCAWQLAAGVGVGTAAAGESAVQPINEQVLAVSVVLGCLVRCCRPPMLLNPAQLLACQPHRLLAAACALPVEDELLKQDFGRDVAVLVVTLSAHKALSGRVRSWLAPPSVAATAVSPSGLGSDGRSGGSGGDACAGCLAAPLRCAIRPALGRPFTAQALALLKLAAGEVVEPQGDTPCCPGGGGSGSGSAAGGFLQYAAAVYKDVQKYVDDPKVDIQAGMEGQDVRTGPWTCLRGMWVPGATNHNRRSPLLAPAWPRPPPLVLPPGRDLALLRLRVCGNQRCGNFGCEGEWALPLKQCGGCRAVRYCGADCQRAHWQEGHKAECKALAAGVASR